jgi:glutamine amidotransferase
MLAVIDYQAGNQTSVRRALDRLGVASTVTNDPQALEEADGLIFPGVGAAGQAMAHLRRAGLDRLIKALIEAGRPFLGICLGCQIMLEASEENDAVTLGALPGRNAKFKDGLPDESGRPIRIPHMGWNVVRRTKPCLLWRGIEPEAQFYFVHSYYPQPASELVLGLTSHGLEFASVFGRDGLWAVQFHPEKSGRPGLQLLRNFHDFAMETARA